MENSKMDLDGSAIKKGILNAFLMILAVIGIIGGIFLAQYVYSIVLGSVFEVTNSGNLPVTGGTLTFLNDTETAYFSISGDVIDSATFAGSLIPIAVILLVFAGLIVGGYAYYQKQKDKGGSGGNY